MHERRRVLTPWVLAMRNNVSVQIARQPSCRRQRTDRSAAHVAFHPTDNLAFPPVMTCAGADKAMMRSHLQQRAVQKLSGRDVGKSILSFGCRAPTQDFLYMDSDLKTWVDLGIVDIKPAFSRACEYSHGCKYVQE